MENKNNCGCGNTLHNVKCDVKRCAYHSDGDFCHAESIRVSNASAQTKGETFCSTYELK